MLGEDHYIYRLRAACIQQPEWNRHQLAALDHELTLVRAAPTPEAHLEASGHMIGLARATALDRAANAFLIARQSDDPWTAAAAAIEFEHAQRGSTHVELYTNIQYGHQLAAPLRARAAQVKNSFYRLFINLLHVHTSNFELEDAYSAIGTAFGLLRASDPAFLRTDWYEEPRYNSRLPWTSGAMHEWLEPYWDEYPSTAPAIPSIHLPEPGAWGTVHWPDAEPLESPRTTTVSDLYIERQSEWPDEFLAAHWHETRDALLAARSPIAQEAVATERDELFSIESTRHQLYLSALLAPLRAIANNGWERTDESREGLEKAVDTTRALTGMTPVQILASPRIRHFLAHNLEPRLEQGTEGFGALAGEAGFDLLRHACTWLAVAGTIDFTL